MLCMSMRDKDRQWPSTCSWIAKHKSNMEFQFPRRSFFRALSTSLVKRPKEALIFKLLLSAKASTTLHIAKLGMASQKIGPFHNNIYNVKCKLNKYMVKKKRRFCAQKLVYNKKKSRER
jgi:hypothetical protein